MMCLGCCLFSFLRSSSVVTVLLGTLNLRIPRWSDVVDESRIGRHVDSLKT